MDKIHVGMKHTTYNNRGMQGGWVITEKTVYKGITLYCTARWVQHSNGNYVQWDESYPVSFSYGGCVCSTAYKKFDLMAGIAQREAEGGVLRQTDWNKYFGLE